MVDEPTIAAIEPRPAAVIHLVVPRDQIQQVMGPAIGEVMAAVRDQGLAPAGPLFSHHHRRPTDTFDFEVGVPVVAPIAPSGRVRPGTRPGASRVAMTTYRGPYEGLADAWGEFMAWIERQGLAAGSSPWESYRVGPGSSPDPADWQTDLHLPLLDPA